MSQVVIGINVFGVLVSLFSISVTVNVYRKYRLNTSILFIISSIAIFIWNILHLAFNMIPSDANITMVRVLWQILVFSGIIFVYAFVFGYSNLRYENLNWRLIFYAGMSAVFATLFVVKRDWVDVEHTSSEGWVTKVHNPVFWSLFSLSILLINFLELLIPLVNTYAKVDMNRRPLLLLLTAILLALFSNALEPLLTELDLPQAIRFLVADIGFLIFFVILLRYPFTGLYDTSRLIQVIVANEAGVPQLIMSTDQSKSILASGALIGINSVLEEIVTSDPVILKHSEEITRKIELGIDQFYIIIQRPTIIVFQFQNPTGVCFAKFKSLGKIFSEFKGNNEQTLDILLQLFSKRLHEYFESFATTETK